MKRLALTLSLIAGLTMIATPAQANRRSIECRYQTIESGKWTVHENELTVACFAAKFGVSKSTARYVAYRESHFDETAVNRSSMALGLYQHLARYWPSRVKTYAPQRARYDVFSTSWSNPRTNAVVTMAMVRNYGWGPWGM